MAATETCDACRFAADQYDLPDVLGTLRAIPPMWRQAIEGIEPEVLSTRPAPEVWSALEYLVHCGEVVDLHRLGLEVLLNGDDLDVGAGVDLPSPDVRGGLSAALDGLERAVGEEHAVAAAVAADDPAWRRARMTAGSDRHDAAWLVRHTVHDVTHHLMDIGRGLHQLGAGAPTQEGTVAQVSASDGGVPKRPVTVAEVGDRGLLGDRQADRKHHGRPLQALCLWSLEVIEALQAEGHPIGPGAAGENLTLRGIDWTTLRPGTQLLVGDGLVEISAWATPCAKNAQWFADRDFHRIDHEHHPGWSRAYAWVREPGTVRPGDAVVVEP